MNAIYPPLYSVMNNRFSQCCLLLSCLLGATLPAKADELLVAVASNFIKPMQAISQQFTQATGHQLKLAYGSSGKLMAQISHGAPFDVFLSADKHKVDYLLKAGLAKQGSEFIYAQGRLVLWSTQEGLVDTHGAVLKQDTFKHIALADAKLAPYGQAAEQVLDKLNISEQIKARIVHGENISQTYQFIQTGNAQLGFVALSQITHPQHPTTGSHWLIPSTYHQPIEQYAVQLTRATGNKAAAAFSQFLKQDSTYALIRAFGYDIPDNTLAKSYAKLR